MDKAQFEFYGYSSPTDGTWQYDGTTYTLGEDFRTPERYREYLDVGMTIVLLQHENDFRGGDWETSNTKLCMDNAYKAGCNRVIVADKRLQRLGGRLDSLIGENADFKSEEEFDRYVKELISPYVSHPAFYGIQLKDEPKHFHFVSFGQVYRSLKRVVPDAFLQCNLYPMGISPDRHAPDCDDLYEAYRLYLENYLLATNADSLCYDEYPFRREGITHGHCMRTLQIMANVCKAHHVEFRMVLQSFSMLNPKGQLGFRQCGEAEMYWQLNLLIGLGVRNFGYFTYFTKQMNKQEHGIFLDGASFINRDGTKTKLYHSMKRIHAELQRFAPIATRYAYQGMQQHTGGAFKENKPEYLDMVYDDAFALAAQISVPDGAFTVTELAGEQDFLYMLHNSKDPFWQTDSRDKSEITVTFKSGYKADVFYKGEIIHSFDTVNPYTASLSAGQAEFIRVSKRT